MSIRNFIVLAWSCLNIITTVSAEQVWYNPMEGETPYVCGRAWNKEIGRENYHRIPDRFKSILPKDVWGLSSQTAGISVRFQSDSRNITIRYVLKNGVGGYYNMAMLNHSGIDIYATDKNGSTHWIGNHMKWKEVGDTLYFTFDNITNNNMGLLYEVFFPPYNEVTFFEVGVDKGSSFQFARESLERPIVIYGTSIVQGASPSRPGLMWTNIIKRRMQCPVINMGFSGSAFLEPSVFNMLSEIDARAFIIDPIPNSFRLDGDTLVNRTIAAVRKLRQKSNAPILLVENYASPDSVFRSSWYEKYHTANLKYREAYEKLKKEGIKNLYYLYDKDINFSEDAMIESVHPNDIGNMQYADAVEKKLRKMKLYSYPMTNKTF